ncbi:uncharacterized protein TNCV_664021 [Trichonephila clavipes]|nr:uncharacterized protein TNCV_664021 [Trichonephila clavipes]
MVPDLSPACHEFEPLCRRKPAMLKGWCTLNLPKLKDFMECKSLETGCQLRRALSRSWRVCAGGWRPATHLPRTSQTCSIGFMSGEHGGHSIRTIPSSKRKSSTSVRDNNRSEDLIAISASSQRSISNDVEVCAPFNGDATIHQHSPTAKSDTFEHERRIIPTATVPPDENTPIIRINRKTGSVKKEHCSIHFSSILHALLPTPCVRDDALMLV